MTDFFALLDQPRKPWLDQEDLQEAFHQKSRVAHPDAGGSEAAFAAVNEGYRTLSDPKGRLQHLLLLEGQPAAAAGEAVADDIAALFQTVAGASQAAEQVMQKFGQASHPLSRSLLQPGLRKAQAEVEGALAALRALEEGTNAACRRANETSDRPDADFYAELRRLAGRYAYLTRWIEQLKEKQAQLSTC